MHEYNDKINEIIPIEKKIRPFIVLTIYDEKLLVASVTSNGNNRHNIEVAPWSYAKTNDVVVITEIDKTFVYLSNKRTNKTFYIPCCIFDKYFN